VVKVHKSGHPVSHIGLSLLFKHSITTCQTSLMESNYLFPIFNITFINLQMNHFSFFPLLHAFSIFSSISAHITQLFPQCWILLTCNVLYMFKTLTSSNLPRTYLQLISTPLLEEFYTVLLYFCSDLQHTAFCPSAPPNLSLRFILFWAFFQGSALSPLWVFQFFLLVPSH